MKKITLNAKIQTDNTWATFGFNPPIVLQNALNYKTIDEAKNAPIVQQLFYLPFVKSVRLEADTIQVERFDILDWQDVLEEVREQLENYLNQGGSILHQLTQKNIPVTLYAESTPNPAVMKFVANKVLVHETVEYKNIDEAKPSPLAQKLFHFPFVKEVFMDANYISITKYDIASWEDVVMEVREFIRTYIEAGNPVIDVQKEKGTLEVQTSKDESPIATEIIAILDEYIKPAVASDGGNIQFESYSPEDKTVKVLLQGACSGCPSSTITLKNGIETMLKEMLPNKVETVVAIND